MKKQHRKSRKFANCSKASKKASQNVELRSEVRKLNEKLAEAIVDFANAIEAACVQLKKYVAETHGVQTGKEYTEEDFNALFWETKEGTKGKYQQTSKKATNNHPVFQTLQTIVKEKGGFCILGGYKYWSHQGDVDIIDRRKK